MEWGFCKKHAKTIQSDIARKEFEKARVEEEVAAAVAAATGSKGVSQEEELPPKEPSPPKKKKPQIEKRIVRKNAHGLYEDTETHIVFDPVTKEATGKMGKMGRAVALTEKDKKLCRELGWKYKTDDDDDDDDDADISSGIASGGDEGVASGDDEVASGDEGDATDDDVHEEILSDDESFDHES